MWKNYPSEYAVAYFAVMTSNAEDTSRRALAMHPRKNYIVSWGKQIISYQRCMSPYELSFSSLSYNRELDKKRNCQQSRLEYSFSTLSWIYGIAAPSILWMQKYTPACFFCKISPNGRVWQPHSQLWLFQWSRHTIYDLFGRMYPPLDAILSLFFPGLPCLDLPLQ